jgi:hypothetical protein
MERLFGGPRTRCFCAGDRGVVITFVAMFFALLDVRPLEGAPRASASLVQTGANTFAVTLSANDDANFGVANYLLPIDGAKTFTHVTPRVNFIDENDEIFGIGYTYFRTANDVFTIQAGQSLDAAVQVVRGIGQQRGNLTTSLLPGQQVFGSTAFSSYTAPMVVGMGTFEGGMPSWANSFDQAAVQLYSSLTGRGGPLTKVSTTDLILQIGGGGPSELSISRITTTPATSSGVEFNFGVLPANQDPAALPLTLSMEGFLRERVNISSISLVGPHADKFTLSGVIPTTYRYGQRPSFSVDWAAPGQPPGVYTAQLILNNDSQLRQLVLDIQATVIPEPSAIALLGGIVFGTFFAHCVNSAH